jgi:MFS family permease
MVLSAFFFFTCFSLGCGFAQSVEQLIIFRTLQGIGGAGLYSLTMVICPEISPPRLLHYVVGSLGATVAVAGVCGPVLGGVITGGTTWRWIFWLKYATASLSNKLILTCEWCSNWCGHYDCFVFCLANERKHHTNNG